VVDETQQYSAAAMERMMKVQGGRGQATKPRNSGPPISEFRSLSPKRLNASKRLKKRLNASALRRAAENEPNAEIRADLQLVIDELAEMITGGTPFAEHH